MSALVITAIQNMAGNNAKGIKTGKARATKYAQARLATPVDVISLQETTVKSRIRPTLDKLLAPRYRRAGGGKGRYIYTANGLKVIASGLITTKKSTWWKKDDKQAAWVIFEKSGIRGMDVSYHLESDPKASKQRLAQITDILFQGEAIARRHGVAKHNILWAGDANSTKQVDAYMASRGYPNAAAGTKYENRPTFIGWDGKSKRRVDYAHGSNAVVVAVTADPKISDHAGLRVRRNLTVNPPANKTKTQETLNSLGFYAGKADGTDGAKTRSAIRRFQAAWNLGPTLVVDGIAGAKTVAALKATVAAGGRISASFKASEFKCKCHGKHSDCLGIVVFRADLAGLEQLRANAYPSGLTIVSAYRCLRHNKSVGGSTASRHLVGDAFDIPAKVKVDSASIPARFKGQGHTSAGLVRHIDSRDKTARWKY